MANIITRLEISLERFAKKNLHPRLAILALRVLMYFRYVFELLLSGVGYVLHGHKYPQRIIVIAGLPKSGTTWLEEMLTEYPGFQNIHIPGMLEYGLKSGGSHDYELDPGFLNEFRFKLAVVKIHSHASRHNVNILKQANLKYVIVYRDPRDVALSYYYFVKERPWHPEHRMYKDLTVKEGLKVFGQTLLSEYVSWIDSWHAQENSPLSLEVRYEQLLLDPEGELIRVVQHLGLPVNIDSINKIIAKYSMTLPSAKDKSTLEKTHFRKGQSGGWKQYFDSDLSTLYEEKMADFLVRYGYEKFTL